MPPPPYNSSSPGKSSHTNSKSKGGPHHNNNKPRQQHHQQDSTSATAAPAAAAAAKSQQIDNNKKPNQQQSKDTNIRRQNIAIWVGRAGTDFKDLKSKGIDVRFFESISVAELFLKSHLAECSWPDKPCQVYAFVVETKAGIEYILKNQSSIIAGNKIATCCLITPWSAAEITSELHQEVRAKFDHELDCRSFGRGSYTHQMIGVLYKVYLSNQTEKQQIVAVPQGLPRSAKFLGQSPLGAVWSFFDYKTKSTFVARHVSEDKRSEIDIEQYRRRSLLSPEYTIPAKPIVLKPTFNNLVMSEKYEKHLEMIFKSEPVPLYLFFKIIRVCLKAMEELHSKNCIFRCLSPLIICVDQTPKIRVETSFLILKEHPKMWITGLLPRYTAPEVMLWKRIDDEKQEREQQQKAATSTSSGDNSTSKPNNNNNNNDDDHSHQLPPQLVLGPKPKSLPHPISEACDVWSLGCCCVRLLTGQQPYTDASCREGERDLDQLIDFFNDLNERKEEYTPELPSHTPMKLRQLIHKMLRMNPRERITVQELLNHELFQEANIPKLDEKEEKLDLATHFKIPIKNDSAQFHKLEDLLTKSQRKCRVKANSFQLVEAWMIKNRHLEKRFEEETIVNAKLKKKREQQQQQQNQQNSPNLRAQHQDPNQPTSASNTTKTTPTKGDEANDTNNNEKTYNRGGHGSRGGERGRGGRGANNNVNNTKSKNRQDDSDYDLEIDDALVAFAGPSDDQVEQCLRHGILPGGHRLNIHETPIIGSGSIGSVKRGAYLWRFPISAAKAKRGNDELKEGDVVDIIMFDIAGGYSTQDFDGLHQFRSNQYDEADIFVSRDELYCVWPKVVMQPKYVLRLKIQKAMTVALSGPRRFVVLPKLLGKGGFGSVFAALQLPDHRPVACKTYHIAQDSIEACRTEFEAMKLLRDYEHVAKVIGFELHEGMAFLFMELLSCNLADLVEACGPLPEEQVVKYFYESACGLESLMLEGRVHSDIKIANIGISNEGVVKLLDFGLMTTVGSSDLKGFTLNYVAPEILIAQKNGEKVCHSHASDVYSLAISMFMLLKGWMRLEFKEPRERTENGSENNNNNDTANSNNKSIDFVDARQRLLMTEMASLRHSVSPQLRSTLLQCLSLDPSLRPTISELTDLESLHHFSRSALSSSSDPLSPLSPHNKNNNNNNTGASFNNLDDDDDNDNSASLRSQSSLMTRTVTFASSAIFGPRNQSGSSDNFSSMMMNSGGGGGAGTNRVGSDLSAGGSMIATSGGSSSSNQQQQQQDDGTVFFAADVTQTITFGNFSMPAGMMKF